MQPAESSTRSEGTPIRILLVCTANICRSPLAVVKLENALASAGLSDRIVIASAGTNAVAGAPQCSISYQLGQAARGGLDHREGRHQAQALDVALASAHDLILTAERRHRASAVSLDPSVRDRTFTLREVVALARVAEFPHDGCGQDEASRFRLWALGLDALRGTVPEPPEWRRRDGSALDIHDGHGLGTRRHRRALLEVEQAADEFADVLVELLGAASRSV